MCITRMGCANANETHTIEEADEAQAPWGLTSNNNLAFPFFSLQARSRRRPSGFNKITKFRG